MITLARRTPDWDQRVQGLIGLSAAALLLGIFALPLLRAHVWPPQTRPDAPLDPKALVGTMSFIGTLGTTGSPGLYLQDLHAAESPIQLDSGGAASIGARLSPDGEYLAFGGTQQGTATTDISVLHLASGDIYRLTDDPANDFTPAWSPDGTQLVFTSMRDGQPELYRMNADGSHQQRLTINPAAEGQAVWSPYGRQIAFVSDRQGNQDIFVMQADGSTVRQLTHDLADEQFPAWSPDGAQLVFTSSTNRSSVITIMRTDGSDRRQLTDTAGVATNPVWSPDGDVIAFVRQLSDSQRSLPCGRMGVGRPQWSTCRETSVVWIGSVRLFV